MDDLKIMADRGWKVRQRRFGPTICFSYPSQTHSISVTGDKCQLNCAHCGGHYLHHMKALENEFNCKNSLARSLLISGGCTMDGKVPIRDHVERLTLLKQGKRSNVHVGFVQEDGINGKAFETSGCPDCNRPYYDESPRGVIFNYYRLLVAGEIRQAILESGVVRDVES